MWEAIDKNHWRFVEDGKVLQRIVRITKKETMEIPQYNQQKQIWVYQGRVVFSVAGDLLYDPATKKLMTTGYMPDTDGGSFPGIPDPDQFVVYRSTYNAKVPDYHPDDAVLAPVKIMSPLITPTPETANMVLAWMRMQFPALRHELQTNAKTLEVTVVTTNGNSWPVVINGAGPVALKLDRNGGRTAAELGATFTEAGLTWD